MKWRENINRYWDEVLRKTMSICLHWANFPTMFNFLGKIVFLNRSLIVLETVKVWCVVSAGRILSSFRSIILGNLFHLSSSCPVIENSLDFQHFFV